MAFAGGGISWAQSEPTQDGEGYYLLGTADHVEWFADKVNAGPQNLKAKLVADIDMMGVNHTPIGTYSTDNPKTPFTGTFDGQGHVISNLYVHTTDKREAGFFSRTDGATVQNIGFENATIESAQNIRAGVLGGEVYRSTARNIYVFNATVTTTGQRGGLAGEAAGTTRFTNCWTTFATFGATSITPANSYAAVTTEQMESGELAYNLNAGAGSTIYYQDLPALSGGHPTLNSAHGKVYKNGIYRCPNTFEGEASYSNTPSSIPPTYTNGICSVDGCFEEPELSDGFYQLGNAGNVEWFAEKVNAGLQNLNAKLTANIDMSRVQHTPIGTFHTSSPKTPYTGKFDGQGYVISNLTVNLSTPVEVGFFSRTNGATISNVGFKNASITSTASIRAGVLGGEILNTTVINVYSFGEIAISTENSQIGGLAGEGASSGGTTRFTNCWTSFSALCGSATNKTNCYEGVTDEQMASGELCYKLNGDQSKIVWTQNLSGTVDAHPVLGTTSSRVYKNGTYLCPNTFVGEASYSNIPSSIPSTYTNGICSVDGCFEEPELDARDNYYMLTNAGNVEWFSAFVNAGNMQANAKLTADIDFENVENLHTPIGNTGGAKFNGTFDGQGHRIKNLIFNKPTYEYAGFFGWLRGNAQDTWIKNLIIDETCSFSAKNYVAAVAGAYQNTGATIHLQNVVNEGSVTGTGAFVGGLLGGLNGDACKWDISNCVNAGTITSSAETPYAGALAGWLGSNGESVIQNFINVGEITGYNGTSRIGRTAGTVKNLIDAGPSATAANDNYNAASATSGELCYMINGSSSEDPVWFQTIGTDAYPSPLNEGTVYRTYMSGANSAYSNTSGATVASMTLTDKADYAADANFTAESLTYNRTLEAGGYHSLCLPFAVTTTMLGSGSKLFTLSAIGKDAVTLNEVDKVAAGTPCFASVTSNFTFGEMTDVEMVKDVDNSGTVKGTFTNNDALGAGFYKLDPNGTYFGLTTDGATATAFRSYIAAPAGVKTLNILLSDGTSITTALSEEQPKVIYDLAGRRVEKATKGLYIINGKKVVK